MIKQYRITRKGYKCTVTKPRGDDFGRTVRILGFDITDEFGRDIDVNLTMNEGHENVIVTFVTQQEPNNTWTLLTRTKQHDNARKETT